MRTRNLSLVFLAAALLHAGTLSAQTQAWADGWQYRKILDIPASKDAYPVEKVAVLDFFGSAAKKDGSDIRVIDGAGKEIPVFIVSAGPDDRYSISFPAEEGRYFVYYGNPQAAKTDYGWYPKRGLMLEVRRRKSDNVATTESAMALVDESRKDTLYGRGFREKIWDGTNPFGPQVDVVKIYNGYFYVKAPSDYTFATSSAGPSYLLIDDKMVASWPGWHDAEPLVRPERSGTVNLKDGLHKLTYYQIGRARQEIAVAAIRQPGAENKFIVIPQDFFLPVIRAEAVKTEENGKNLSAGFGWENTNYLRRERWELLTFRFFDESFPETDITERAWSFGDGQTASGKEVYHTWLKKGTYPVTLKIKDRKGGVDETTLQVLAEQDYSKMVVNPRTYQQYIDEFGGFNHRALGNEELFILAELYESYDRIQDAYKIYRILKERNLGADDSFRVSVIAAGLAEKTGDYAYAEAAYKKLLENKPLPEIMLKLAALYLATGKIPEADATFRKILQLKDLSPEMKKKAEIGTGDVYRINGNYDKASEAYKKLMTVENPAARAGTYAQAVLYYLKQKDFSAAIDELAVWAQEIPGAKLDGQWSVLMARALIIRKDYRQAIRELEIFTKICKNVKDNLYYGWALYLTGESYEDLGDKTKAEEFYRKTAEQYPGSQLYDLAAAKLPKK